MKGVLLGDFAVGKSSLFQRYHFDNSEYNPTIGVDYFSQQHDLLGHSVRLQLWDTAGQERFRSIIKAYVRSIYIVFLVFDVTRRDSFLHISRWLQFVLENNNGAHRCVVVANKVDCPRTEWVVEPKEIHAFAEEHDCMGVYFVSALKSSPTQEDDCNTRLHSHSKTHYLMNGADEHSNHEFTNRDGMKTGCPSDNTPLYTPVHSMFVQTITNILQHIGDGTSLDPLMHSHHLNMKVPPDRRIVVSNNGLSIGCNSCDHLHRDQNGQSTPTDELETPPDSPNEEQNVRNPHTRKDNGITHFRRYSGEHSAQCHGLWAFMTSSKYPAICVATEQNDHDVVDHGTLNETSRKYDPSGPSKRSSSWGSC